MGRNSFQIFEVSFYHEGPELIPFQNSLSISKGEILKLLYSLMKSWIAPKWNMTLYIYLVQLIKKKIKIVYLRFSTFKKILNKKVMKLHKY